MSLRDRRKRQDSYYRRAKREGYAARSVFKLEQLDRRFNLLAPGQHVLDLGCRPGSWLQYACSRIGRRGHAVGLDRTPLDGPTPANASIVVGDVLDVEPAVLRSALGDEAGCFHVVLSDMAPDTTGIAFTDQVRSAELFNRALELTLLLGCGEGSFVGKIFMGEGFQAALAEVRRHFRRAKTVKPEASRKSSSEVYVVATGRRPPPQSR